MKDEEIPLIHGSETEEDGYAAETGPHSRRKEQRKTQKDPEERRYPPVILRHQRKQVESNARFHLSHGRQGYPAMNTEPVQPVGVQQDDRDGNTDAVEDAKQRDGNRRLWSKEEAVPGFSQLSERH